MADTKFTILGMTGSGKTCYLLGMYYKMCAGMDGYSITTDEDSDVELRNRYAKISDQSLGKERFPAGTDSTAKYEFDLQYAYNKIMSFDWMDYPGIILVKKNDGNLEEYEAVKNSINNSSSLFICIDGAMLIGEDVDEKIERVRDNCSSIINSFISEYLKTNKRLPPTAIVVTKYDLCKDYTNPEELCRIAEDAFSPLFVKDSKHEKIVTIIPVSIGANIGDENCSGKLKPLNIHLPIFMGIWFALDKEIKKITSDSGKLKKESDDKIADLQRRMEREYNRIFRRKKEINRLITSLQIEQRKKEWIVQQRDNRLIDLEKNKAKLIKELGKMPYIYIDGERSSFENIIERKMKK